MSNVKMKHSSVVGMWGLDCTILRRTPNIQLDLTICMFFHNRLCALFRVSFLISFGKQVLVFLIKRGLLILEKDKMNYFLFSNGV